MALGRISVLPAGSTCFETAEATLFRRGYIGNLREVAARLDMASPTSAGLDEARILGAARARWGPDITQQLEGEFALVWVERSGVIASLHHDEYGLTPLFYACDSGRLRIAFHLDELATGLGETDLDPDYIRERLRFGDTYSARTPYRGIRRLLPGQSALWDGERLSVRDCWSACSTPMARKVRAFEDDAVELRALVASAIAASTPPGSRTWTELSGGLDSSTVTAMALRRSEPGLEAITYAYPGSPEADESTWVARFRAERPLPLHYLDGDACPPFTKAEAWQVAEPTSAMMHAGRDAALERLLEAHDVDCLLTGNGGDEVLFGYSMKPYFLLDQLRAGQLLRAAGEVRHWSRTIYPQRSSLFWLRRLGDPPAFAANRGQPAAPWLTDDTIRHAEHSARRLRPPGPREASVSRRRYMEAVLTGARVVSTSVAPRRSRAEFRSPLFHRPLVEFCRDLPWRHQAGGPALRPLLRAATVGILPESIRLRTDKPNFDQVLFRGLRSPASTFNGDTREGYLVRGGFIDPDAWAAAKDKARLGFAPEFKAFLATANLEIWLRSKFGPP